MQRRGNRSVDWPSETLDFIVRSLQAMHRMIRCGGCAEKSTLYHRYSIPGGPAAMLPFITKTPYHRELPLGPVPVPVAGMSLEGHS